MTELQESRLKATTFMALFVVLFNVEFWKIWEIIHFILHTQWYISLCKESMRQTWLCWLHSRGGGRAVGSEAGGSLSQSLKFPGLLLQASDMHAILKRCHPQLDLTIHSTNTVVVGGKKRHCSPTGYLHHLLEDISQLKPHGIYCFHSPYELTQIVYTASCWLCTQRRWRVTSCLFFLWPGIFKLRVVN